MGRWFLQGAFSNSQTLQEIPLNPLPQILGRDTQLAFAVQGPTVSRHHARIEEMGRELVLTDLGSSNGTFVNRQRICALTSIDHGDIIHLGSTELRLINRSLDLAAESHQSSDATCIMTNARLSDRFPTGIKELENLIATRNIKMVYQPIIRASDLQCIGYEALCRGANEKLPGSPLDLFRIAESFNLETDLSEMLREEAFAVAEKTQLDGEILVNTHPIELRDPDRLINSMAQLRQHYPQRLITLEIHEHAMTDDDDLLKQLKQKLKALNIKLAFDDFGVGQSRLMEMIEAEPDLIKFDKKLIEQIHMADANRVRLVNSLLSFAKELKIQTLAECVGDGDEYDTCNSMGFDFYQGFYFEKPKPATFFTDPDQRTKECLYHRLQ
jgi:EAL domain-containing protein (putative c-di-GMP-specific phosphodiesterase class I)